VGRTWVFSFVLMCGVGAGQLPVPVRAPKLPAGPPIGAPPPPPIAALGGSGVVPAAAAVVLKGLAARAGVIFAGHVVEVRRNDSAGYVDVVFAVDRAVRGCDGSQRYVLREWAGLWADEPRRYGVGQRLLMIVSARGASGMSAPVGGMAGRIPLVGARPAVLARAGVAPADTGESAEEAVDLRWVEAAALRRAATGVKARAETGMGGGWGGVGPVGPVVASPVGVVGPGLSAVLAVLSGQ
jgi:hypothetical protein